MKTSHEDPRVAPAADASLRTGNFTPPRRRWPGLLVTGLIGAGIAALAVSNFYDKRSLGEKLDAGVANTQQKVDNQVQDLRNAASAVARNGAMAAERTVNALGDAGITAAVKTALAADPSLSALRIEVNTEDGVVRLDGPAPDTKARERAEVLAAAPQGVTRVDNRLVVAAN